MKTILLLATLFIGKIAFVQDTLQTRKFKVLPVPAFGFSPETSYYIGAVSLFTYDRNDQKTRASNAKVEFNYTWNRQIILESQINHFFKEEKWFLSNEVHYSKYPDRYYGIGAATADSNEVLFQSNRFKFDVELSRKIKPQMFIGGGFRYFNYNNIGILSGPSNLYDELTNRQNIELKVDFFKDSRNRLLTPTEGEYYKVTIGYSYTDGSYIHMLFDARKYYSLGKKKNHVVAARILQTSVLGNAPFYDLAILGGDFISRGYFYGRFRDKHLSTLQLEYRTPYLWRLGLSLFGGNSLVYGSSAWSQQAIKPNAGIGLRFLVDKKDRTNLRFDYAIGRDGQSGFYVSFGESF
ncbi:MAG: hypothetical protein DCO96_12255 [Fluviicola sp. XM-24bin1]|nr:MAG: hypothetical protein DCO96_12255 [Fluviicola sp. XM-24bin1]